MIENKSVLTIPHSFEAEQSVLGAIFLDNDLMNDICGILSPNSFHSEYHRHIYAAMLELFEAKTPVDAVLVGEMLKSYGKLDEIGGFEYISELVEAAPSSGNMVYYAKIIQEHALLRDLISITNDIGIKARDPQQGVTDLLIEAETKIREIALNSREEEFVHIKEVLRENLSELETLSENKDSIIGVSTGFIDLDMIMSGLLPADLILIAARPGMGKTALALNIANYAGTRDSKKGAVAVVSREMQNIKLTKRMLASEGKIDTHFLKTGNTSDKEAWDRLINATDILSSGNIYFNEKAKQIDHIIYQIRSLDRRLKDGIKLVIIDYLQIVRESKGNNREQEIASISGKLKDLAKDLNIPVIALSQLNRGLESRSDKRPELSDLRESGALEQDADVIIFIYRDDYYDDESKKPGVAELIIKKHRDGPTGLVELQWNKKFTKFVNLSRNEPYRY